MANFNWACLIATPFHSTVAVYVNGETDVDDDGDNHTEQARGLFGAISVRTKIISAGEEEYLLVNNYKELSQLLKDVQTHAQHLHAGVEIYSPDEEDLAEIEALPEEDRPISMSATFYLANAYLMINDDVLPIACALHNINEGVNASGNEVWLETSAQPGRRVAPSRPPRPSHDSMNAHDEVNQII